MFDPTTCADIRSATSSPGSASGPTPCAEPDGPTQDPSGPAPALASLSARQAKAAGFLTSGTFGLTSTISSASADLQSSLASKLRAKTDLVGSTLYKLTWKVRVTPQGRSIFALRASALPISDSGFGGPPKGWPTPMGGALPADAALAGWATPTTRDWKDSGADIKPRADGSERLDQIPRQANLAGWATPVVQQANGTPERFLERKRESMARGSQSMGVCLSDLNMQAQAWAGWPTPQVADVNHARGSPEYALRTLARDQPPCNVALFAHLASHPQAARLTVSGEMLTGSSAGMENGGQLDPAHSRWLMGLPSAWDACGVTAMQSLRPPRKPSSKRISKAKPTDIFG